MGAEGVFSGWKAYLEHYASFKGCGDGCWRLSNTGELIVTSTAQACPGGSLLADWGRGAEVALGPLKEFLSGLDMPVSSACSCIVIFFHSVSPPPCRPVCGIW